MKHKNPLRPEGGEDRGTTSIQPETGSHSGAVSGAPARPLQDECSGVYIQRFRIPPTVRDLSEQKNAAFFPSSLFYFIVGFAALSSPNWGKDLPKSIFSGIIVRSFVNKSFRLFRTTREQEEWSRWSARL